MTKYDRELAGGVRKATNVSLDVDIVAEAKQLGINISRACEHGLAQQIAQERGRIWRAENTEALEASNTRAERHGLPLVKHRQF